MPLPRPVRVLLLVYFEMSSTCQENWQRGDGGELRLFHPGLRAQSSSAEVCHASGGGEKNLKVGAPDFLSREAAVTQLPRPRFAWKLSRCGIACFSFGLTTEVRMKCCQLAKIVTWTIVRFCSTGKSHQRNCLQEVICTQGFAATVWYYDEKNPSIPLHAPWPSGRTKAVTLSYGNVWQEVGEPVGDAGSVVEMEQATTKPKGVGIRGAAPPPPGESPTASKAGLRRAAPPPAVPPPAAPATPTPAPESGQDEPVQDLPSL